jgi:RNA polymerase sigma-70 factor (ECF subfamily)
MSEDEIMRMPKPYLPAFSSEDDRQTFEDIYLAYKDIALRAALNISNNLHMAEDALHNGFLQIIKDWEKFMQISSDKRQSFVAIIVKNKMIDLLRKEKKLVSLDGENEYPDETDLAIIIERKEEALYIRESVAKLPEKYKTVLELKYFHDMSNPEIAATLEITPHNVAVRISRAIAFLAKTIKEGAE